MSALAPTKLSELDEKIERFGPEQTQRLARLSLLKRELVEELSRSEIARLVAMLAEQLAAEG